MRHTIGVIASDHLAAGLVEGNRVTGKIRTYPEAGNTTDFLQEVPAEHIAECIRNVASAAANGGEIGVIGVGIAGIIRDGAIEESPNLKQIKGLHLKNALGELLPDAKVLILNDADAMAAGIAATRGQLDKLIRVWTLGRGIGYGRYPRLDGIWEGGHCVVTMDPKEQYCGCGGVGHVEGIMGLRAMRMRFLDLEPDEVFALAEQGDNRCRQFVKLWHRALAGATASSIHLDGPGKFYITGPASKYVETGLLHVHLAEMVKMSTLQGSFFEVIPTNDEIAILGAAVNAGGE